LWRSADRIWTWAGDTATDYNHYTKRALLSGVMASTTLFWMQDNSPASAASRAFLDRRIDNVLNIGRLLGTLKKKAA
jgi:ubiquinone biosynthesis protein COQ9